MDKVIDARQRRTDPMINNLFMQRSIDATPRPAARLAAPEGEERGGTIVNLPPEKRFGFIKPSSG